jgi:hypothetical protein
MSNTPTPATFDPDAVGYSTVYSFCFQKLISFILKHLQTIQLPASLNGFHGPAMQKLYRACAVHCNARAKYFFAAQLHLEILKVAETYEQQAKDALDELQRLTVTVADCMDLAVQSAEVERLRRSDLSTSAEGHCYILYAT